MDSKELYEKLKELWEEFEDNHEKFAEKGNKAAGGRARKSIGEIKKLVTEPEKHQLLRVNEHSDISRTFGIWINCLFVFSQRYILA